MNKTELAAILASGTPKQKALLIIEDNMNEDMGKPLLTSAERKKIENSFTGPAKEVERREYRKYIIIAEKYENLRFRLYALQQNIEKILAKITALCYIWEMSDHYIDFCNNLLLQMKTLLKDYLTEEGAKIDSKSLELSRALAADNAEISRKIDELIYENGRYFANRVEINKGKDGRMGANIDSLKEDIDSLAKSLTVSLGLAKGFVVASEDFCSQYDCEAFIPEDVAKMLSFFKEPYGGIPERYLMSSYEDKVEKCGKDSFEAKAAKKYAILPTYKSLKAVGVQDITKNVFTLR